MPRYDNRCRVCLHVWETIQSMTEDPPRVCPECGKPDAERLITSAPYPVFKGSGFYETDYKKRNSGRPSVIERF